jgi:hypothetical protein
VIKALFGTGGEPEPSRWLYGVWYRRLASTALDLKKRAAAGQLAINAVTVALEAGRSRGLVGCDGCRYAHIRELILQASGHRRVSGVAKADAVEKLRGVIKVLQSDLAAARTLLAAQRITIDTLSRRVWPTNA